MTSPKLPIETKRLQLRSFERDDVDAVMGYHALPEAQRYLRTKARDRGEVKSAVEAMRKGTSLNRPGDCLSLAIERKSDGLLVGQVSLHWHDATAAQAELSLVFGSAYRRQGYGEEVARAAITLGFETFQFHRIFACCDARNQASARLLKKLGMRLEAHYREHALVQGEWDEELHFAILDREWGRSPKVQELAAHRVA